MVNAQLITTHLEQSSHLPCHEEAIASDNARTKPLVFFIVGDRFARFSDQNVVLTYTQALEQHSLIARLASHIVIGQGVSSVQILALEKALKSTHYHRRISIMHHLKDKAATQWVDKGDDANVFITYPIQINAKQYCCFLVVDENCAELSGFNDGEHLPGMLLIEAAKQIFMASIRLYQPAILNGLTCPNLRFTLSGMKAQFDHFVFPLESHLQLTLEDIKIDGLRATGAARIVISQLGRPCCHISFDAQAYSQTVAASLEHRCGLKFKNRLFSSGT